MSVVLVTGGAGFFGSIVKNRLLASGHDCVSVDRLADGDAHPRLRSIQCDLRDRERIDGIVSQTRPRAVIHCAAVLAHGANPDRTDLWKSNVDGTRNLAEAARRHGVGHFVFTSSNCLWGESVGRAVTESDPPNPVEPYGRSKLAGEDILREFDADMNVVVFRCPTIIDSGRLGLLTILFDFIREGRKVWVVGDGSNRYQFIFAQDLASACLRALGHDRSDVFNIGSDEVGSMRDVYRAVIAAAGSKSKVRSLPKAPTLLAMKLAYKLGVSPLGPYHYKMIAEDFLFDTTRVKERLGWRPTLTNAEMLIRAYQYYDTNYDEIAGRSQVSTHRQPAAMGVIRLVKWLS